MVRRVKDTTLCLPRPRGNPSCLTGQALILEHLILEHLVVRCDPHSFTHSSSGHSGHLFPSCPSARGGGKLYERWCELHHLLSDSIQVRKALACAPLAWHASPIPLPCHHCLPASAQVPVRAGRLLWQGLRGAQGAGVRQPVQRPRRLPPRLLQVPAGLVRPRLRSQEGRHAAGRRW
jgi:hypothetical protein